MTDDGPKVGKKKGIPPLMAFLPSNTLLLLTKSCSWLLTLHETMVQPCRLMVHVVLLPRSIITTGGEEEEEDDDEEDIFNVSAFSRTKERKPLFRGGGSLLIEPHFMWLQSLVRRLLMLSL